MSDFQTIHLLLDYQAMTPQERSVALFGGDNADNSAGTIYLLGSDKLVSIGYTRNVDARLATLTSMFPVAPDLLCTFPGTRRLRNLLVALFDYLGDRRNAGWFAYSTLMKELVAEQDITAWIENLLVRRLEIRATVVED